MCKKLAKCYTETDFAICFYANDVILELQSKLVVFDQESWDRGYSAKYSDTCCARFLKDYDGITTGKVTSSSLTAIFSPTVANYCQLALADKPTPLHDSLLLHDNTR
jgi:hypothetical protein